VNEDVAHHIRTPLASIQTAAHVLNHRARELAAGKAKPEEVLPVLSECLTVIEQGVDRIDRYSRGLHERLARQR
jgi:signal transduction histidine kinase